MDTFIRKDVNRVILISDIHLGIRNASFEWIENMTKYFDNFFIPLIRKYKEAGDKCVVIVAGDYYDNMRKLFHLQKEFLRITEDMSAPIEEVTTAPQPPQGQYYNRAPRPQQSTLSIQQNQPASVPIMTNNLENSSSSKPGTPGNLFSNNLITVTGEGLF